MMERTNLEILREGVWRVLHLRIRHTRSRLDRPARIIVQKDADTGASRGRCDGHSRAVSKSEDRAGLDAEFLCVG